MKEASVLIVESDPYKRNWMALLLARDWRSQVIGEVSSLDEVPAFYQGEKIKKRGFPNMILFNVDQAPSPSSQPHPWLALAQLPGSPALLMIGESSRADVLQALPFPGFCGYLLKPEIRHSLAWAAAFAMQGDWVITPSLEADFESRFRLERQKNPRITILNGHNPIHGFTENDADIARMAVIFSMERGELSDEIKVTKEWVYGLISELYKKLGLEEIRSGEVDPAEYFGEQFARLPQVQAAIKSAAQNRKGKDLETLAYHILTMPAITELR